MQAIRRRTMLIKKPAPAPYFATPSPDRSPPPSSIFTDFDHSDGDEAMEDMDESEDVLMTGDEQPQIKPRQQQRPPPLLSQSRPVSIAPSEPQPLGPYCPRVPTLDEILANAAPPPWTLSAFTAYLSQNHCLENLEFVTDVDRYRRRWAAEERSHSAHNDGALAEEAVDDVPLGKLWSRLVYSYVARDTPREINLPSDVRDTLLAYSDDPDVNPDAEASSIDGGSSDERRAASPMAPPPPAVLDPAVKVVHELLNESVLMAFVHELSPAKPPPAALGPDALLLPLDDAATVVDDGRSPPLSGGSTAAPRRSSDRSSATGRRTLTRRSRSPSGHRTEHRRASPPTSGGGGGGGGSDDRDAAAAAGSGKHSVSSLARSLTNSGRSASARRPGGGAGAPSTCSAAGSGASELAVLSDDGASAGSPVPSPMTPPTTPPGSERGVGLSSSPRGAGNGAGWRKMMGRLGSKRKGSGSRSDAMEF